MKACLLRSRCDGIRPISRKINRLDRGNANDRGNGDVNSQIGIGINIYCANISMLDRYFYNADGEMLLVPQQGRVRLMTEMGVVEAAPNEIAVIPRGVKFRAELPDGPSRGYVCENYGAPLRLPDLGPIGSNGLANARDFCHPWRRSKIAREISSLSPNSAESSGRAILDIRRWILWRGMELSHRTNTIYPILW